MTQLEMCVITHCLVANAALLLLFCTEDLWNRFIQTQQVSQLEMCPYSFNLLEKLTYRAIYIVILCIPVKLAIAFSYSRSAYPSHSEGEEISQFFILINEM